MLHDQRRMTLLSLGHTMQILYQGSWVHGAAKAEEKASAAADQAKHRSLLLSVHAAAHEEALHAISQAAADCDVAVHPRCASTTEWLCATSLFCVCQSMCADFSNSASARGH